MSYNNQIDFTGSTQSDLDCENAELVSNCCRAYPRLEVNSIEWNDEDYGICPTCGERCEYVEEDREADAYDSVPTDTLNMLYEQTGGVSTITYDDGTVELIDRGIIQPNVTEAK